MSVAFVVVKFIDGACRIDETVISPLAFWSYILVIAYLLPLVIICILYIIVAAKLWLHEVPVDHVVSENQRRQEIPKKKVIRMLIIILVVFAVCWLPAHVHQIDDCVKMGAFWPPALIYFCYWLSLANSAINPWLYIGLNGKMKAAFTEMIRGCRTENVKKDKYSLATTTRSKAIFSQRSFLDTRL